MAPPTQELAPPTPQISPPCSVFSTSSSSSSAFSAFSSRAISSSPQPHPAWSSSGGQEAMGGPPPGFRPSGWVHLLHQVPHTNFQLRPVASTFAPQEQDYQQALLLVAALAGLGLAVNLLVLGLYLLRSCCRCRRPKAGPPEVSGSPDGGGCVTWSCVAALLLGCAGIGLGFYGNSETSDGVSQLSFSLLHANHTLSSIDRLVSETVERLGSAVRSELTTLEEVMAPRTELVAAARGARRQAEAVAQQLGELAFWRDVPLSPIRVAEGVSFVEEYRWLAYILLLLLDLLVCLFTLLGLAKQSKWLVIVMTVMSLLVLVLSWGSMGLEAAAAVGLSDFCSSPDPYVLNLTRAETGLNPEILHYYFLCNQVVSNPFQERLTLSQRSLASIYSQLQGLEREAVPQFPAAQKPLLALEETLNVTEGNFHQLVALLHCRGLHKDYGAALRGLCEDSMEGLLFLLLFSLLSALALATALCSLPAAWAHFPASDDYEDPEDDDPFNPQESKRFVQWQSSI